MVLCIIFNYLFISFLLFRCSVVCFARSIRGFSIINYCNQFFVSFIGFIWVFLAFQGFNFRNNDALLVNLEGEEIALKIESLFLEKNLEIKARECSNLLDMGLWRPIKSLVLEKAKLKLKNFGFQRFFIVHKLPLGKCT